MKAIAVLTNRGLPRILAEGGSQAWKLDPVRVRRIQYIVCVQNHTEDEWGEPTHHQGQAFLIGKISGVSPSTSSPNRYIVEISEYAEIDIPNFWEGWRNPVRYVELDSRIDPSKLKFKPLTATATKVEDGAPRVVQALDMTQAKTALSAFYKVPISAIEITIRG